MQALSDSTFCFINRDYQLVDVVDESWLADRLSDDEIEISEEFLEPEKSLDEPQDKWLDFGLSEYDIKTSSD